MDRQRVVVIGGGQNSEHDVSLASAASVAHALDPRRFATIPITIGVDGVWRGETVRGETPVSSLASALAVFARADVVFPVLHGPLGEDGTLAALCELARTPYVGSGVRAGALAMDKWATKLVAEAVGVRTAQGVILTRCGIQRALDTIEADDLPVVVKPVASGSSCGVTLVRSRDRLAPAIEAAFAFDERVLVEELVTGREIDLAILDRADGSRLIGPPLEIGPTSSGVFDRRTKYDGSASFNVPTDLRLTQVRALESAATAVFDALGCSGLARIDFFLAADGPVLNEVNTMPGMTSHSQVPRMFAALGMPYADLLTELVTVATRDSVAA